MLDLKDKPNKKELITLFIKTYYVLVHRPNASTRTGAGVVNGTDLKSVGVSLTGSNPVQSVFCYMVRDSIFTPPFFYIFIAQRQGLLIISQRAM